MASCNGGGATSYHWQWHPKSEFIISTILLHLYFAKSLVHTTQLSKVIRSLCCSHNLLSCVRSFRVSYVVHTLHVRAETGRHTTRILTRRNPQQANLVSKLRGRDGPARQCAELSYSCWNGFRLILHVLQSHFQAHFRYLAFYMSERGQGHMGTDHAYRSSTNLRVLNHLWFASDLGVLLGSSLNPLGTEKSGLKMSSVN